jgi:capsular polysaccharide export protein
MNTAMRHHFLFLQGMPCDLFRKVGDRLEGEGHQVSRINVCFNDWLFWHDARATNYRGRFDRWPVFFERFVTENGVTDLVLMGEQRKYHREAVALATHLGVRVMASDFGYLRPDWITLVADGVGGQSSMPKSPEVIRRLAARLSPVDLTPRFRDSALRMSVGDLVGSLGNVFLRPFYPFYRQGDERPHPLVYFPAMGLSLLRKSYGKHAAMAVCEDLQASQSPFFVFPLQLDHDFQIRAYSPFSGMRAAASVVLASFARHAPSDCLLVLKSHPWDPGLIPWRRWIEAKASELNIRDRVVYVDGGNLDDMMCHARGVITVNSTSGLQALRLGCPVKTLGAAVYDVDGLTHQQRLDTFWQNPSAPDAQLVDDFIRALVHLTQIRGVFFAEESKSHAIEAFAERLLHPPIVEA